MVQRAWQGSGHHWGNWRDCRKTGHTLGSLHFLCNAERSSLPAANRAVLKKVLGGLVKRGWSGEGHGISSYAYPAALTSHAGEVEWQGPLFLPLVGVVSAEGLYGNHVDSSRIGSTESQPPQLPLSIPHKAPWLELYVVFCCLFVTLGLIGGDKATQLRTLITIQEHTELCVEINRISGQTQCLIWHC